jgi:sugar O-acyltransferase (sialic acid O-acetyltransferase NeuD family)
LEKIIIIGGKGTAINIAEQICDAEVIHHAKQRFCGFLIDDPALGNSINNFPVLGKIAERQRFIEAGYKIIFALYKPEKMQERVELFKQLELSENALATFVHPHATVMASAKISPGSVVMSGVMIGSNVRIGCACIINAGAVIEHDTCIGNNNFIAAGAILGANIHTGEGNFIGLNASIRENITMGAFNFVGMGSVIVKDIKNNALVYGNPGSQKNNLKSID